MTNLLRVRVLFSSLERNGRGVFLLWSSSKGRRAKWKDKVFALSSTFKEYEDQMERDVAEFERL